MVALHFGGIRSSLISIEFSQFCELNTKYTYSEYLGGHAWSVWTNNLHSMAPLLFI
jgi:hypothetical protein